ncbi:cupredoxin domain-containing protein [Tenacibaculum singaporense]|uniref:EfeO-type cupredoxin-like domain-containing protein n=1 Tax=Tenacibaculum singaporense TaxID=2358479 RepID=A0A3S8R3W9_9FLAO|nr:cupredoxin domain-containing protein [Tenacibaculum singaporense]AZJ34561.1 hypothetical protein D6T69_03045 [Tenacibaculum singaporense]
MKKVVAILVLLVGLAFTANAQKAKTISLEQTKGKFTQKSLSLSEGTYVFEISNKNVGHDVGFVLAPKGKTEEKHHIKNAYVTSLVKNNSKSSSKKVTLTKGEYVYFCPLNPTPQYTLTVK